MSFSKVQPSSSGETTTASDTLTINTNCSAGYSVYVSAQNGKDNNLTNTNSSVTTNNTITPSSAPIGGTSTTLSANTWGINSSSTDVESGKYYGLPTYAHATTTALTTKADVDTSSSSTIPIYYGAKVTTSIAPGTYSGDVLYTVLSNPSCSVYTIVFNANGGTGEMDNQTINVGQSTALHANEFERTGYTFLGWSNTANGKTGTATNGIGTIADVDYENEASVTDLSDFNTEKTLYAIWTLASDGDMQTWTGCSSLSVGQSVRLKDTRDDKIYAVKKLPDNKCWMMQNLTIGSDGAKTLSADNTNMQAGTTSTGQAPDASGYYYLPPAGKQGSGTIADSSTLNATDMANFDTSVDQHAKTQFRAKGAGYNTAASGYANDSDTGYYNFYTATLGYSYYNDSVASGSSLRDICPKGWRLPKTTNSGTTVSAITLVNDFTYLARQYSASGWQGSPTSSGYYINDYDSNNAVLVGIYAGTAANNNYAGFSYASFYSSTSPVSVGSVGGYLSSSVYNSLNNYYMMFDWSSVSPQSTNLQSYGYAARCLAQNNYTVSYNANGGTGSPSKSSDTIYETGELTTAGQGTLSREGYNFLGWSLSSSATTASYNANTNISIPSLISSASSPASGSTITLYAVWEKQKVYMQGFNCNSLSASGEIATLVDSRDGQEYTVYRIPTNQTYAGTSTVANIAGKCIMTKDLNLGAVASVSGSSSQITANGTMTLSPTDSNFTIPSGSGESITVPTTNVQVTNGTSSWGDNNNTYNTYTNRMYTTGGTGDYASRGYYSWGAAMVACPKNWRLPTEDEYYIGNDGSWEVQTGGLAAIVKGANAPATISNITGSPYSFVFGGGHSSIFFNATTHGYYWSSTQYSSTSSYISHMHSSNGLIRSGTAKYSGYSVRCIADVTMQEFDSSSLSVGNSTTLSDARDGSVYTVKKFSNGETWMTSNLILGHDKGYALTKELTNIPDNDDGTLSNNGTYYLPQAGYRGALNNSSTSGSATFDGNNDNQAQVQYRATGQGGDTDSISGYTLRQSTSYYNFYAITLGCSYYGGSSSCYSGYTIRDICPKGWQLPAGGSNTTESWVSLDNALNSGATNVGKNRSDSTSRNNFLNSASFFYSGYYGTSRLNFVGSGGYWWSSTTLNNDKNRSYRLTLTSSYNYIYPQDQFGKYYGLAIRCVAK